MPELEVDPVDLHVAGDRLSTAADDSAPVLDATTGENCGRGFPGTMAGAHAALVAAWREQNRELTDVLHSTAALLHDTATTYVATDEANAASLQKHSPAHGSPPSGPSGPALNL